MQTLAVFQESPNSHIQICQISLIRQEAIPKKCWYTKKDLIYTMSANLDCNYLFIDCSKDLRQYSIPDVKCVKIHWFKETIGRVIATLDSKYTLLKCGDGNLQQICVKSQ
jgi:hypothetical protein